MQVGHNRPARRSGMRIKRLMIGLVSTALASLVAIGSLTAQSPPQGAAPAANLNQLMRGLFFPHSNVIFFTQIHDPAEIKQLARTIHIERPPDGYLWKLASRGE